MAEEVLYSLADGVATITLNRPDRLNALNSAMYHGLTEAFDQTDRDDKVRAVIVTGAGRAFCAGADLSGGARTFDYGQDATTPEAHRDPGGLLVLRIFRSLKPVTEIERLGSLSGWSRSARLRDRRGARA
jgi:enoyl-CoA hydratase/carnithine racemase